MKDTRAIPVIFNPTAGGGRARRRRADLEKIARQHEIPLDWRATRAAGHAVELASTAADEGHPLLFAFGGDGTYNEVARGLLGRGTSMGILPAGTTSVLAYEFAIPRPVGAAMSALLHGEDRQMHVGRTEKDEIFLIMLSAGPDSMTLQRLLPSFKKLGGRVGVALQGLLELLRPGRMPFFPLHTGEEKLLSGWTIIGKSKCYAGPFEGTPGADPFSRNLEAVVQTRSGRRAALSFILGLARGRHVKRQDVRRFRSTEFRIDAPSSGPSLHYQVDGDLGGLLPVRISLHPDTLRIRLPAGYRDH